MRQFLLMQFLKVTAAHTRMTSSWDFSSTVSSKMGQFWLPSTDSRNFSAKVGKGEKTKTVKTIHSLILHLIKLVNYCTSILLKNLIFFPELCSPIKNVEISLVYKMLPLYYNSSLHGHKTLKSFFFGKLVKIGRKKKSLLSRLAGTNPKKMQQ